VIDKKYKYNIAVVGATGAVGRRMLATLEERNFPVGRLSALASARSVGQRLPFRGGVAEVKELREDSFMGIDIALFLLGVLLVRNMPPSLLSRVVLLLIIAVRGEWKKTFL